MIKRNIWKRLPHPLELNSDNRGSICDVFYDVSINHVAVITSKKGAVRGNHYHKKTTQHILILKGEMEYWYLDLKKKNSKSRCIKLKEGDIVSTPPYEIHALRILKNNKFIVFSQGLRGGKDYEKDTFRVNDIINK